MLVIVLMSFTLFSSVKVYAHTKTDFISGLKAHSKNNKLICQSIIMQNSIKLHSSEIEYRKIFRGNGLIMKINKLKKMMAIAVIITSISTIIPMSASAEWLQDSENNWNWTENGSKAVGWKQIAGIWYHFNENGKMQTGWVKDENSKWYYMNSDGSMKTGWLYNTDGKWYYMNSDGSMKTGWIYDTNGKWYFANSSGIMQTGITEIEGKAYALGEDGAMLIGTNVTCEQSSYKTDDKGVIIEGKLPNQNKSFNKDGAPIASTVASSTGTNETKVDNTTGNGTQYSSWPSSSHHHSSSNNQSSNNNQSSSSRNIISISDIVNSSISVDNGTSKAGAIVILDENVKLKLSDNTTTTAAITWKCDTYDGTIAADYDFIGNVILPDGVSDTNGVAKHLNAKVTVKNEAVHGLDISDVATITSRAIVAKLDNAAATVSTNQFKVKKNGDNSEVPITSAELAGWDTENKTVIITLGNDTVAGNTYSLISGQSSANFDGVDPSTTKPTVTRVSSTGSQEIKIEFSKPVMLEGIVVKVEEAYGSKSDLAVLKYKYGENSSTILCSTIPQQVNDLYGCSISGAKDFEGNHNCMDIDTSKSFARTGAVN